MMAAGIDIDVAGGTADGGRETDMRARIGTIAVAALALGGLVACEPPPPPPPVFEVSVAGTADDALPGDGVCETEAESGWCTLTAAVQEGNALGRAVVVLPGRWEGNPALTATITGDITIRGTSTDPFHSQPGPLDLAVAPGASLALERLDVPEVTLSVQGRFVAHQSGFSSPGAITVEAGGTAQLLNSLFFRVSGGPLVENQGTVVSLYSTFANHTGTEPMLVTAPGGSTTLAATRLASEELTTACAGEVPVSLGYNSAVDGSCGLTAEGDQPSAGVTGDVYLPFLGSPQIDAIPQGVLGCGNPGAVDVDGNERPYDADGDGDARCDIGAWEHTPPVP